MKNIEINCLNVVPDAYAICFDFSIEIKTKKICTNIVIITGNDRNDPMKRFIMRVYDTLRVVKKINVYFLYLCKKF